VCEVLLDPCFSFFEGLHWKASSVFQLEMSGDTLPAIIRIPQGFSPYLRNRDLQFKSRHGVVKDFQTYTTKSGFPQMIILQSNQTIASS
jgi:hypothetical protein